MRIYPIRDEESYERGLRQIAALMESEPAEGTDEFDELEILVTLVEAYEHQQYSVGPAGAVETLRFHLERLGWTQTELARRAGIQASHLSAVLNNRRELTLMQVKKLSGLLEIAADELIDNPFKDSLTASRA